MTYIAKEGRQIVAILFAIFIVAYLFFDSSFVCFLLFLIALFLFKNPERELSSFDENIVVSPADLLIKSIYINEDKKKIEIIGIKSIFSTGVLRAMVNSEKISYYVNNGIIYANDENAKNTQIRFNDDVQFVCKNGFFTKNIIINRSFDILKGQSIGFMLDGEIKIELPYNSELLIALGDKILANSSIARLGE